MKVLYVTSGHVMYPHGNLNRYIVTALPNLQAQTEVFDLRPGTDWVRQLDTVLERFGPDFVFSIHGQFFTEETVCTIRKRGAKCGMWFVDDPYDIDASKERLYSYDYIFTTERNCVPVYQRYGYRKVYSIMFGTQKDFFFPEVVGPGYRSDVCLVGSPFQGRTETMRYVVSRLPGVQFRLAGPGWDLGRYSNVQYVRHPLSPEEVRKFYNGAKINLNVYRVFNEALYGGSLNREGITASSPNARTFDIAACRSFQLCTDRPEIREYFDPTAEMVTVQNDADLVEKISKYLHCPEERRQIAMRAYSRTLNKYQLEHSLAQMFEIVKHDLGSRSRLIKGAETPGVYLVANGVKCPIPSVEVFERLQFRWEDVAILEQSEIEKIPDGPVLW